MLALISSNSEHYYRLQNCLIELECDCKSDFYYSIQDFAENGLDKGYDPVFIFCPSDRAMCIEIKGLMLSLDPSIRKVLVSDDPDSVDFKSASDVGFNIILPDTFPKYGLFPLFEGKRKERDSSKINSLEYWSLLQDYTRELRCVLDDTGRIVYSNAACDFVVGYTPRELEGNLIFDYVDSSNLFQVFRKITNA